MSTCADLTTSNFQTIFMKTVSNRTEFLGYLQPKSPAPRVSDTATQDWLPKAKLFTPRYCVRDKIFDLRDTKQVTLIGWLG